MFLPTPSRPSFNCSPTEPTKHRVLPRATLAPSINEYPAEVVIQLTTTLLIPDYPLYYNDDPISDFHPNYAALPDGSLIAAPYRSDLTEAIALLLFLSVLATIFLWNAFTSGSYIRRINVQRKYLFQTLFASQIIAFIGLVPQIASFMTSKVNCEAMMIFGDITATVSLGLIMTGIFGYKAYKCLDNSTFVLVPLSILTLGIMVVSLVDLITLRTAPRLTVSCLRTDSMLWMRVFIVIQLVQSLFLCCCFLYAVWKSRHSLVARYRISDRLSMDFQPCTASEKSAHSTLGHKPEEVGISPTAPHSDGDIKSNVDSPVQNQSHEQFPSPFLHRSELRLRRPQSESTSTSRPLSRGPPASLAPSTLSRISHYMPMLFRRAMKDELWYTIMTSAAIIVVAMISVVGMTQYRLWLMVWVGTYWAVASIFATHSLGRAVCRHERESLIQDTALDQRRSETDRYRTPTARGRNISDPSSSARSWNRRIPIRTPETRALTFASSRDSEFSSLDSIRSLDTRSNFPVSPSPTFHFPTSGRTTPLVPLDSTRAVLPFITNQNASSSDYSMRAEYRQ